jgi:hypothetical protein
MTMACVRFLIPAILLTCCGLAGCNKSGSAQVPTEKGAVVNKSDVQGMELRPPKLPGK